ncbi:hypothetical protein Ctob_012509, partial [Chrysochromulina tobinii]
APNDGLRTGVNDGLRTGVNDGLRTGVNDGLRTDMRSRSAAASAKGRDDPIGALSAAEP